MNKIGQELTFKILGGKSVRGKIRNANASLASVAETLARRSGLAGTYECLDPDGQVLAPECRLSDLPTDTITLAPELTPAFRASCGFPAG